MSDDDGELFELRRQLVSEQAAGGSAGSSSATLPRLDEQLLHRHRGIAVGFASKFARYVPRHFDEYVAAGELGLLEAISTFDPTRGAWSSWALLHVRKRVLEAVRLLEHPTMTTAAFADRGRVHAAVRDLESDGIVDPPDEDVALLADLPMARVRAARRPAHIVVVDDEDLLGPSVDDDFTEALAMFADWPYLLRWGLWTLPRRELHLVARLFGLDGREPEKRSVVAGEMGISREAARQLERRALARLRDVMGEAHQASTGLGQPAARIGGAHTDATGAGLSRA